MFKKKDDVARMMQAQGIAVFYMKYLGNARVAEVKGEDVVIMALIQVWAKFQAGEDCPLLTSLDPTHQRRAQEGGLEGSTC